MRVASVVAPAVAALLSLLLAGCSSSSSASLCSRLTAGTLDFGKIADASHELGALDQLVGKLSPRDRRLVEPVRDYARILYRRSNWSEDHKAKFVRHFFAVDAPALDQKLRDDCNVSLDKHINPFAGVKGGGT